MGRNIANIVLFNVGWFASIIGAGQGLPWLGPLVVLMLVAVHLSVMRRRWSEAVLLAVALPLGWVIDSLVVLAGALEFPAHAAWGGPSTLWMAFMWVNFACLLNVSLRVLASRPLIAAGLGLVGGPVAYFSGARFGAVMIPDPQALSLLLIGVEWAVATPLLFLVARLTGTLDAASSDPSPVSTSTREASS